MYLEASFVKYSLRNIFDFQTRIGFKQVQNSKKTQILFYSEIFYFKFTLSFSVVFSQNNNKKK